MRQSTLARASRFRLAGDVVDRAAEALRSGSNQYPPMRGLPELRRAVADHYRLHHRHDYDVEEITITSGATEALAAAILALVSPGDEVVLFQPLYDAYLPLVRRAGGVPRLVTLEPPEWRIRHRRWRRPSRRHAAGHLQQSAKPDRAVIRRR
jgi:aspartate/methionine/tyrosine aminotransferase